MSELRWVDAHCHLQLELADEHRVEGPHEAEGRACPLRRSGEELPRVVTTGSEGNAKRLGLLLEDGRAHQGHRVAGSPHGHRQCEHGLEVTA